MSLIEEAEVAAKGIKLSTTTIACILSLLGGIALAETYEHTLSLGFGPFHVRGMGVKLKDAAADQAKAVAAAQAKVAKQEAKAANITATAETAAVAEHTRIEVQTRTIIQKVPTYVSAAADVRYAIPWGLVRLHDAAVSGRDPAEVPIPASAADDAPSTVEASALASNDADNFGQCRQAYAVAFGLQQWVRDQKALSDKAAPP